MVRRWGADTSGGTLYQLLKLDLIKLASPPHAHDASTDFLVAAYFGWILSGIREWIEKRYGIGNAKLFLNVAAPMDHYEDVRIKQRYLKILGMAWECIFGDVRNLVTQGMSKSTLATWFSRDDIVVPEPAVRPYDVLPETIAPIVSLSQDPRMAAGMYLLVDMGAGTTELSTDHVSVPGGDQNVLCYYDRSVLLGAERFQPKNGNTVFDIQAFLARPGLGRKILNLKKNETAFVQGDPADAIFYVQRGQLRVTVTSANGKEATIALVGAGEFLGENCMVSAHPVRLATATAMTECALLRISKTDMVRVLHQEPRIVGHVRLLSSGTQRSHPGRSGRSAFQFQRKAACEDSATARAVRQGKQTRDGGS